MMKTMSIIKVRLMITIMLMKKMIMIGMVKIMLFMKMKNMKITILQIIQNLVKQRQNILVTVDRNYFCISKLSLKKI